MGKFGKLRFRSLGSLGVRLSLALFLGAVVHEAGHALTAAFFGQTVLELAVMPAGDVRGRDGELEGTEVQFAHAPSSSRSIEGFLPTFLVL